MEKIEVMGTEFNLGRSERVAQLGTETSLGK